MLDAMLEFVAWCVPRICVCCSFISDNKFIDLCGYCKQNLPWLKNRCYKCGGQLKQEESIICDKCNETPPPFDRLCGLFDYAPPLRGLINRLKFNQQIYPAQFFAELMAEKVENEWYPNKELPEVIIPVPLHFMRQKQRGYNQALEICKPLSNRLGIPIDNNVCLRIRNTLPQARLDKDRRVNNIQNAFLLAGDIKYQSVVIIDDVVTTGNTIRAICNMLQKAGVKSIEVWCVCKG